MHDTQGIQVSEDPGSDYLITVQIEPRFSEQLDANALHRLAMAVLRAEGKRGALEMGVVITTDEEVHSLNREYLGHDYLTDVISFGMSGEGDGRGEREFVTPAERVPYLGDVVISFERAAEQAPDYEHSTQAEVATLLIHGTLHLLGYHDNSAEEHERMYTRQDELLHALAPDL